MTTQICVDDGTMHAHTFIAGTGFMFSAILSHTGALPRASRQTRQRELNSARARRRKINDVTEMTSRPIPIPYPNPRARTIDAKSGSDRVNSRSK